MDPGDRRARERAVLVLCREFVAATPVDGAAFIEMASDTVRELWCASDARIAEVEELQYDLGEGPAQDAFRTGRPVLVSDLTDPRAAIRWPVFVAAAEHLEIGGLFALPMQIGVITVGVCEVYRLQPGPLAGPDLGTVLRALDNATLRFLALRVGIEDHEDGSDSPDGTFTRHVHQATGMLVAQLGVSAETAFARLRGHAYANGTTIGEVARDIVERRVRLEVDPP